MKIIFYNNKDNKIAKLIAYLYLSSSTLNELVKIFLVKKDNLKNNLSVVGSDKNGVEIVALGCYKQKNIVFNLMAGINNMFNIQEKIVLVDTNLVSNHLINLGQLAIKLKLKKAGEFLIKKGIAKELPLVNKIIRETKERIKKI